MAVRVGKFTCAMVLMSNVVQVVVSAAPMHVQCLTVVIFETCNNITSKYLCQPKVTSIAIKPMLLEYHYRIILALLDCCQ